MKKNLFFKCVASFLQLIIKIINLCHVTESQVKALFSNVFLTFIKLLPLVNDC